MKPHHIRQSEQDEIERTERTNPNWPLSEVIGAIIGMIFILAWLSSYISPFYAKWIAPIFGWFA
jgi:hypothetical protein